MSSSFYAHAGNGKYELTFTSDIKEHYDLIQKVAQSCVDGVSCRLITDNKDELQDKGFAQLPIEGRFYLIDDKTSAQIAKLLVELLLRGLKTRVGPNELYKLLARNEVPEVWKMNWVFNDLNDALEMSFKTIRTMHGSRTLDISIVDPAACSRFKILWDINDESIIKTDMIGCNGNYPIRWCNLYNKIAAAFAGKTIDTSSISVLQHTVPDIDDLGKSNPMPYLSLMDMEKKERDQAVLESISYQCGCIPKPRVTSMFSHDNFIVDTPLSWTNSDLKKILDWLLPPTSNFDGVHVWSISSQSVVVMIAITPGIDNTTGIYITMNSQQKAVTNYFDLIIDHVGESVHRFLVRGASDITRTEYIELCNGLIDVLNTGERLV